jgi:hypothetical protein
LQPSLKVSNERTKAKSLLGVLESVKKRLIRQHVYHRALSPSERGIIHLVERLSVNPQGYPIIKALVGIISKARAWLRPSKYQRAMVAGRELARKNSLAAVGWGLEEAESWALDRSYILFLGWNSLASAWHG